MTSGSPVPRCSICCECLGAYGGPVTLPCGHNGCLQCMAVVQRAKPACPLCRAPFPADQPLVLNHELRDLVVLAKALHTVELDGWQTVTSEALPFRGKADGGEGGERDVALVPSAPPMHVSLSAVLGGDGDLLSLEPPTWLPDSQAMACGQCSAPFMHRAYGCLIGADRALRRTRHHCRLCGGIFCHACCQRRMLLPPKFQRDQPQRLCGPCAELLEPLQPFLAGTIAQAVQVAVHDVTDGSAPRAWLNNPLSASLADDIYKATNIARCFAAAVGSLAVEKAVPAAVLREAVGFALLSVAKGGAGWSVAAGTGLVVARRPDGGWSAPSAVALYGLSWGLQLGAQLCDLILVLRNRAALAAFCGGLHCAVGGGASAALGPLGRSVGVGLRVGAGGAAACLSYSAARGFQAGIALEASLLATRDAANLGFYGRPVTARQLLMGSSEVMPLLAASALHRSLDELVASAGASLPRVLVLEDNKCLRWWMTLLSVSRAAPVLAPICLTANRPDAHAAPSCPAGDAVRPRTPDHLLWQPRTGPATSYFTRPAAPPAPEHPPLQVNEVAGARSFESDGEGSDLGGLFNE